MSELAGNRRFDPLNAAVLLLGAASGVLYLSLALSFAFLLPLQTAFGRHGRRAGYGAALTAGILIAAVQAFRIARLGGSGSALALLIGISPPLILVAALVALNLPIWSRLPAIYRILALVLLASLLAAPGLAALRADAEFRGYLEERIGKAVAGLTAQAGGAGLEGRAAPGLATEGYELSALRASLDPAALVGETLEILSASFAAIIFLLLGGSWWLGNRAAGEGSPGRRESPALSECRLPYALVWPFLLAWSAVFAAVSLGAGEALRALAWNAALVLSLAYGAQGLGIASHYLKRWNMPRPIRIALGATLAVAFVTPPLGLAAAAVLPLLGFTEVWIPYRNPKGVGA